MTQSQHTIQPEISGLTNLKEAAISILLIGIVFVWLLASIGVFSDEPAPVEQIQPLSTIPTIPINVTPTTPLPPPTPDWTTCGYQDSCLHLRDWHSWFRENASGYKDLSTHATVYDYKLMPFYHTDASGTWGTRASFKVSPEPGMQFLFVFVNIYSDTGSARQYGYTRQHFMVQVQDQLYYAEDEYQFDPTNNIKELDNSWDFAHVETPGPYGFKIVQDLGTGIKTAYGREYLYEGRSNASDGWLLYQIPKNANIQDIKLAASFDNLGGNVWWKLTD
jgi:hypothetical protein